MKIVLYFKRHWKLYTIILAVCLIVGLLLLAVMAPFLGYKKVSETTKNNFSMSRFYHEDEGVDRAMLMETNMSAWEERIRLMNQAKERIILSTFDMREGESTKDIAAMLLKKADEGVKVSILVDGVSGFLRMNGREFFYALSSHPNIEIKIYNMLNILQPWKTQGRMHDKYVIVDEKAFILGGRNTFDYFIGNYPTDGMSYDREVLIYKTAEQRTAENESALYQVEEYFKSVWEKEECTYFHDDEKLRDDDDVKAQIDMLYERYEKIKNERPDLFEDFDYYKNTVATNHVELIHNPTHIYGKEPVVFYELTELMKNAKEKVIIHTPYAVCNDYMYERLREVSGAVDVEMLINSVENGDNFVASSDYLRHKDELVDTGVQIYEYDGGTSYHGKSVVIDDELSIIGSYNMDLRSTYVDTELMLAVQSKALTAQLLEKMDGYKADSRKVIDENTYETPDHVQVADVPWMKRAAWAVVGFLLQPFRILV